VLGATGSIGSSAADVLEAHADLFEVVALVGGRNASALAELARRLKPACAVLADETAGTVLAAELAGTGIAGGAGASAVAEAIARETDIVVAGISGTAGLGPTVAALRPGRVMALANKECLVTAGSAFMAEAMRQGTRILPLDSEHNALLQALGGADIADVETMTITASGGPFRTWDAERIARASVDEAMRHPTWQMGRKITIDSASLMNKGLELIEAHHLFGIEAERLAVVVHPQSIVHSVTARSRPAWPRPTCACRWPIASGSGGGCRWRRGVSTWSRWAASVSSPPTTRDSRACGSRARCSRQGGLRRP
jgi:1-deoxy-D-xylulose-5-phosphate reductoisomerase